MPEELEGGNPRGLVLLQQGAQQVPELLTHSRIDGRPDLRQDLVYPPNTLEICAHSMSVSDKIERLVLCNANLACRVSARVKAETHMALWWVSDGPWATSMRNF